jgi:hypothetical protein
LILLILEITVPFGIELDELATDTIKEGKTMKM